MSITSSPQTIAVLGGTGKTGRRVAARLAARGIPTRVAARSTAPPLRWEDPSTWPAVLEGTGAAYVAYAPDLAVPGAAEVVGALAGEAARCGVARLVLLSGRGEAGARAAEAATREAHPDVVVVRSSWFVQGLSEGPLRDAVLAGDLALPVGDTPEPFVDADDVADVAVAALTAERPEALYEVTGARAVTWAQLADGIAAASGRPVAFREVPADAYAAELAAHGVPEEEVALVTGLFGELFDGRNARPADGIHRALGRAPRELSETLQAASASGAWA